jgi:hypothetical protein
MRSAKGMSVTKGWSLKPTRCGLFGGRPRNCLSQCLIDHDPNKNFLILYNEAGQRASGRTLKRAWLQKMTLSFTSIMMTSGRQISRSEFLESQDWESATCYLFG